MSKFKSLEKENITWIINYGKFNLSISKKKYLNKSNVLLIQRVCSVLQPSMLKVLTLPVQVASVKLGTISNYSWTINPSLGTEYHIELKGLNGRGHF